MGAHRRLMLALAAVGLLVSVGGCAPGGIAGGGKGQASGATAATVASTDRATVDGDTGDTTDDGDTTDHDDEHEDAANDDAGVSAPGETVRRSAPVTQRPTQPTQRPTRRPGREVTQSPTRGSTQSIATPDTSRTIVPQPSYSSYTICPDISELGAVFTVKRIGVDLWSQRCTRGYRRSMATAQELMTSPADCLNEADSITQAASALARADVGSMPVTGDADQLVGLLTDRDIVVRVLAEGRDVEETTVGDVMTSDMVTVSPDANNEQVLAALSDNQIRRVPVVSNGKVVGMISQADVARDLSNKDTGDVVEAISRD